MDRSRAGQGRPAAPPNASRLVLGKPRRNRRHRAPRAKLAAMIPEAGGATLSDLVDEYERAVVARALERTAGNRSAAARLLGISRQGLALKLKKHGL